jgi:cyclase
MIFGLLYADGYFMQSRNFRLQRVGDLHWLERHYRLQEISFSLDELLVLNVSRSARDIAEFADVVGRIAEKVFIPISAGGGVGGPEDAKVLFGNGADKLVVNSALISSTPEVKKIIEIYGSQSVVASVDYRIIDSIPRVFTSNGQMAVDKPLDQYLQWLSHFGVGEVLLNSIDRDGTGFGFDLETCSELGEKCSVPLIVMGGAGNSLHFAEALGVPGVSSVATANLFNFIGDGLPLARSDLVEKSYNFARWDNAQVKLA